MKQNFSCLVLLVLIGMSFNSIFSQSKFPPISDQAVTSTTHSKNTGKILWADQRIKFDMQDNISYSSEFKLGQPIYGRGYLAKCLYNFTIEEGDDNCLNTESLYELILLVDGKQLGVLHTNSFSNQEWTTFQVNLSLSPGDSEDGLNQGVTSKWANFVNSMEPGSHLITIEFWAGKSGCTKKKYAEGSFTLVKSSGTKIKGSSPEVPQAQMNNPKLENEMIEAVKNQGWKNESPIDVVILESDWRIIRDGFNNITDREINTFVILKDKNGNCRANDISFRQPYNGKKFGKTSFYGLGLKSIIVECSNYGK
jgi:hypothetical protein